METGLLTKTHRCLLFDDDHHHQHMNIWQLCAAIILVCMYMCDCVHCGVNLIWLLFS